MKPFVPIDEIKRRVELAKEDSDTSMFLQLLYSAEQYTKIVVCGLLACVEDDKNRHRYSQEYKLVRASGIGDWVSCLDEVLTGPTSQYLCKEIQDFRKELIEAQKEGSWQYDSINQLVQCLHLVDPKSEQLPKKTQGRNWFSLFSRLRNKTRGHGALSPNVCSEICPLLEKSLQLQYDNASILRLPWVHIKRNLNLKYRISTISNISVPFDYLKSDRKPNLVDGVYLHAGTSHKYVRLINTSPELDDFYFPNGAFGNNTYECISYLSNDKTYHDVGPFLTPAGSLPKSSTEGIKTLELIGSTFTNLPLNPIVYIERNELETELKLRLLDERHPVITLVGRGGIGKTSLAISVLRQLCLETDSFSIIIWLSARDIDLMIDGAKPVKPNILSIDDISKEFTTLLGTQLIKGGPTEKEIMQSELTKGSFGTILFVLDNFETVINPKEVYSWLNTYIRLPNKILITSRFRDFKGDYPIEVKGMNENEFKSLIMNVASEIGIPEVATDDLYINELYNQTDGHPYVAKILLGERLKSRNAGNLKTILARKEDILTALFERTYANLSPVAKRLFLTVSNWRSTIPEIALEAILLRSYDHPVDTQEAIDELSKSSLIEFVQSELDSSYFIFVPLSASLFGKRKLSVDPLKTAVETDTILLQSFGAGTIEDLRHGLKPRVERLFTEVAKRISTGKYILDNYTPVLEYVCTKYNPAWLLLSSLYEEENEAENAIKAVQEYISSVEADDKKRVGWRKLSKLYRANEDWFGEFNSLIELCLTKNISFNELTSSIYLLIRCYSDHKLNIDELEKIASIEKVVNVLEERISDEGEADNYSQLAWLNLFINKKKAARDMIEAGLGLDPNNHNCLRLHQKLK